MLVDLVTVLGRVTPSCAATGWATIPSNAPRSSIYSVDLTLIANIVFTLLSRPETFLGALNQAPFRSSDL
jgi:hypothetical protein